MNRSVEQKRLTRRLAPVGVIFTLLGLLLFVYFVRRAGVGEIYEDIRRLGWGFIIILFISGFRTIVRAAAWTRCIEGPRRLPIWSAWRAYLTGDAVGNLVPMGIVVSEPTKVAVVRDRLPVSAALSGIALENLFYSLSVALFILVGASWLLLSFPLPGVLRGASIAALVGVIGFLLVALLVLRREWKLFSYLLERLIARNIQRTRLEKWHASVRAFEDRVYGFYKCNRRRLLPIMLLEACFHVAGVAEAYVTLLFISDTPPTILIAFLLESVNRVINVVFKFVPLRVGVDEAGSGLLTRVLQLGENVGVTLAITRKARVLFWTGVGVVLLMRRGLRLRDAVGSVGTTSENEVKEGLSNAPGELDEIPEEASVR